MNNLNIERAILSTFLFINDTNDILEDVYKLDLRAFSTPFNKRVAEKLNLVRNGHYGFLSYQLEESVRGTAFEFDWIEILAQTPLTLKYSKRYYDDLLKKQLMKVL